MRLDETLVLTGEAEQAEKVKLNLHLSELLKAIDKGTIRRPITKWYGPIFKYYCPYDNSRLVDNIKEDAIEECPKCDYEWVSWQ